MAYSSSGYTLMSITLSKALTEAATKVNIGGIYHHYKAPDSLYKVLHVALQEKDLEPCVVYQSLTDPKLIWTRTVASWKEPVENKDRFISIQKDSGNHNGEV